MSLHVLIVEDDAATRLALVMLLQAGGYAATAAADVRAALAYLRSRPAPGLILLGLVIPAMDGWRFLAERGAEPALAAVPVLVLTDAWAANESGLRAMGAAEVIRGPASSQEVLAAVRRHCPPPAA
jgi:DNA-binding response OmpR family regulator